MPSDSRPADPRLQAFREEARTILALSGGISAVSMGKVRHRGQAAGLTPEEVDALVADLRSGDRVEPKNLVAFRESVHSVLKKTRLKPGDLLTPRLARKLEQAGTTRFKLSSSDAAQVVRDQAREFDLKRLSPEAAVETFRRHVRAARDSGPLTPSRMRVLRKFADTLGMESSQFDSLVQAEVRTALAHPAEIRKANGRFLRAVIGSGILAVLGFFIAMSFLRPSVVSPTTSSASANPASPVSKPSAPPGPAPTAKAELREEPALDLARRVFSSPADEAILDGLASSKEAERIGAMRSLLLRLDRHRETPEQQQALQRLIASILAADPSSSLVTMALPDLIGRLDLFSADFSLTSRAIDSGFWTLNTLLEALSQPGLDPLRSELLARETDSVLGEKATQALVELKGNGTSREAHEIRAGYTRALYQKLAADAPRDASRPAFAEAEKTLFDRAGGVLPDDERTSLRAEWLSTALEFSGHACEQYLGAVSQVLDEGSVKDAEKITFVYLNTRNPLLQQALDQELRKRLDDPTGLVSPSEVAEAFRLRTRSGGTRRAAFEERAKAALARARESKGPAETMRQVVDLALASTLACALEQGETAHPEFDSLLKGPPKVDPPAGAPAPVAPTPPRPATFFRGPAPAPVAPGRNLEEAIAGLGSNNAFERVAACRSLARQPLPEDLPDQQAFAIARYVLWGGKNRREDAVANTSLVPLTRPVSVRLAMADILGGVRPVSRQYNFIDSSSAERMLISITGAPVNLNASAWKTQARRILLYLVLTDLDPGLDSVVEQYRLLYQAQGRLLGMPESDTLLTARPSQMVEVVTNHLMASLSKSRGTLSEPDRRRLGRISQDLTTADYLASDEPQRLVLFQRAWLKVLALYVSSRRPESSEEARALADGLTGDEAHGHDVLEQLRDGERRALKLWCLLIQARK